MYKLLRPSTLAAIVADLQLAEDNAWIAHDDERLALDDATMALVDNVGPEFADVMITKEKGKL